MSFFTLFFRFFNFLALWNQLRHRYFRIQSKRLYLRLSLFFHDGRPNPEARILSYLRHINPYVFEELVLDSFERRHYPVRRNTRYSGDGGIDGRVFFQGSWHFIQSKRYRSYIKTAHVQAFCNLLIRTKRCGFFIHTGKTGPQSRALFHTNPHCHVLSGRTLIRWLFLTQEPFPIPHSPSRPSRISS